MHVVVTSPAAHAPRYAALAGLLGGLALATSLFLPWAHVQPAQAERFGRAVARAAAEEEGAASGFAQLGQRLATRHALTGLDVVQWSREARRRLSTGRASESASGPRRERLERGWALLSAVLLGVGGAGGLMAAYLLAHRLRRFRAPMQVFAGVLCAVALGVGSAWAWLWSPVAESVSFGRGHHLLLGGGALMLVALVGAVRLSTLVGVLLATLLSLAALAALAWAWLGLGLSA